MITTCLIDDILMQEYFVVLELYPIKIPSQTF